MRKLEFTDPETRLLRKILEFVQSGDRPRQTWKMDLIERMNAKVNDVLNKPTFHKQIHETVDNMLADIRHHAGTDPESAHGTRDKLYEMVLDAIAKGEGGDPQALAQHAREAKGIKLKWEGCA